MSVIDRGALPQVGTYSAFTRTTAEVSPGKLADRLEIWIIPTEVYGKQFQTPHENHFINLNWVVPPTIKRKHRHRGICMDAAWPGVNAAGRTHVQTQ